MSNSAEKLEEVKRLLNADLLAADIKISVIKCQDYCGSMLSNSFLALHKCRKMFQAGYSVDSLPEKLHRRRDQKLHQTREHKCLNIAQIIVN